MSKKATLILASILIAGVLGYGLYRLFRKPEDETGDSTGSDPEQINMLENFTESSHLLTHGTVGTTELVEVPTK